MKPLALVVANLIWVLTASGSERGKSVHNQLQGDPLGLLAKPPGSDLNIVTPEIRDEVIMYLRRGADGADPDSGIKSGLGPSPNSYDLLLRLGDEQTMMEEVEAYRNDAAEHGKASMKVSRWAETAQPLLIPMIAEDFYRDDGDEITFDQIDDLSRPKGSLSAGSALRAVVILQNSPAFSQEVRTWARETYDGYKIIEAGIADGNRGNVSRFLQVMRTWWRGNESHFAAKDYAAVNPGAALAEVVKRNNIEAPTSSQMPPIAPALTGAPSPAIAIAAESQSSPYIIPAAVGLSVLAITAAALLYRRKKNVREGQL